MSDESKSNSENPANPVDISSLKDLSFGLAWEGNSSGKSDTRSKGKSFKKSSSTKSAGGGQDRRRFKGKEFHKAPTGTEDSGRRFKGERKFDRNKSNTRERKPRPFRPILDVQFYPEDNPFQALIKAMSTSLKTYELFNIAKLLLDNTKLFVAVVQPFTKEGEAPSHKPVFRSIPDHAPFFTEDEAIAHSLRNNLNEYFEIEEVEGEAPAGSFSFVHKCKRTGELIGPTNFHQYNQLLQEHQANHFPNKSLDDVKALLETVKDEESIQQWIDKMKTKRIYKFKLSKDGLEIPEAFPTFEDAKRYLLLHFKDEVVRSGKSVRISARNFENLPEGDIKKSILAELEYQKKFPLRIANNLRGRLRRENFHLYKKGSEGISYVCWVKRKFRSESDEFSPEIRKLLLFIEEQEKLTVKDLPEKFLGLDAETVTKLEALSQTPKTEDGAETPAPVEKTPEDEQLLKDFAEMMRSLRWLLSEGYVTEYENGELFARSPLPAPQKAEAAPEAEAPAVDEAPQTTEPAEETAATPVETPTEVTEEPKSEEQK